MFDKDDGGMKFQQQLFELHAREDVDIVERFVPEVEVSRRAETCRQKHFLFLPGAVGGQILFKLSAGKIQLAQNGVKKRAVDLALRGVVGQSAQELRGILFHAGDLRSLAALHVAGVGERLSRQQLQKARLARAVVAAQGDAIPREDGQIDPLADCDIPILDADIFECGKRAAREGERGELERLRLFEIAQKG